MLSSKINPDTMMVTCLKKVNLSKLSIIEKLGRKFTDIFQKSGLNFNLNPQPDETQNLR